MLEREVKIINERTHTVSQGSDACDLNPGGPVSEMAIVDTFTKLIFGEENGFSSSEELIIQTFRSVDSSVALDSHRQLGQYLRALGVAEMVQLVTRVRSGLAGN